MAHQDTVEETWNLEEAEIKHSFRDEKDAIQYHTLEPDWDLIAAIEKLLSNHMFNNVTFHWIAAHEDYKRDYKILSLPAQLNVDADALASRIQRYPKTERYWKVPLSPSCTTHLDINQKTITSGYKSKIRRTRSYEPLYSYITDKDKWASNVMETIDWNLHKQGIQNKYTQRQHYCKLVHDLLPTNATVH